MSARRHAETPPETSRRAIIDGLERLARRAKAADLPGTACLMSSVTVFVLLGTEDLAMSQLRPVLDLIDSARALAQDVESDRG